MPAIVSCFANSYGKFGTQAAIENLRDAGLEYLELPIRTHGVTPFFKDVPLVTNASSTAELEHVDQLLATHDIKVSSCNITSGNPLDPAVVEITKAKLDRAAHFGVKLVVGGAGEADHDQRSTLYQHLQQIGDHAGRLGITYCFETHPGICCDHRGMLMTMQALNHPHLKLNFDTGNLYYYNQHIECEIALAKVCQFVSHVHLKDTNGEFDQWYFPALGRGGAVNFVRVLELMRTCGFQGPYSLEIEGIAGEGELALADHQQRIAESVDYLKNCGYFD